MSDFQSTRLQFCLPANTIYLDGNSLGALPNRCAPRVVQCLEEEWGEMLIRGWNQAGWMGLPGRLGDRVGALIGAPPGSVVMGDTLSIKVYQAVAAALQLNPGRSVILSDTGNFPSDLYMVQGLAQSLERKVELRLVEPSEVADALDDSVAALMLTEVDYRTGRLHDMKSLTSRAHERGVSPSGTWHTRREPFPWTCRAATPISPLAAPTSTSTEGPAHQRSST